MKVSKLFFALFLGASLTSCIRDEGANLEADIIEASLAEGNQLLQSAPLIENDKISFVLNAFTGETEFSPQFKLSKGATISPESGTKLDFSTPQKYVVTSEDGNWKKEYSVVFSVNDDSPVSKYSFDNVEVISNRYHKFYDNVNGQKRYDWAEGNQGFDALAGRTPKPDSYPTFQISEGYKNASVRMVTRSTGVLGSLFGAPLAAGNLFLGTFQNTTNPLKATRFGILYKFKTAPKSISGYFKYKAGTSFKKNSASTRTKDGWDAYAILFEKKDTDNFLLGDHNFSDERIVSVAKLKEEQRLEATNWTKFEIPFELVSGKSFDPTKEYMLTIVLTSSVEGGLFNGAVGSTLDIDEVKIVVE